jgi:hypothetical protein
MKNALLFVMFSAPLAAKTEGRDMQADGIEAPYSSKEPLRIAIECSNNGRRQ